MSGYVEDLLGLTSPPVSSIGSSSSSTGAQSGSTGPSLMDDPFMAAAFGSLTSPPSSFPFMANNTHAHAQTHMQQNSLTQILQQQQQQQQQQQVDVGDALASELLGGISSSPSVGHTGNNSSGASDTMSLLSSLMNPPSQASGALIPSPTPAPAQQQQQNQQQQQQQQAQADVSLGTSPRRNTRTGTLSSSSSSTSLNLLGLVGFSSSRSSAANAAASTATPSDKNTTIPAPVAEEEQQPQPPPFNFQDFLAKMKNPAASDLVTAIREFVEKLNKNASAEEAAGQVHTFLERMCTRIRSHKLWKGCSEGELENASEGLEKYLMSKLHSLFFQSPSSDDALKDLALRDKMELLAFIRPEHLEIPPSHVNDTELNNAITELHNMDKYRSPRDKMICILNCVKIVQGMITAAHGSDGHGADEFLPLLIYVTLKARPPCLYSNLEFIHRFRARERLMGEAGYYLTNMFGAMEFIQTLEASRLKIDKYEFDHEINKALIAREEREKEQETEQLEQLQLQQQQQQQQQLQQDEQLARALSARNGSAVFSPQSLPPSSPQVGIVAQEDGRMKMSPKLLQRPTRPPPQIPQPSYQSRASLSLTSFPEPPASPPSSLTLTSFPNLPPEDDSLFGPFTQPSSVPLASTSQDLPFSSSSPSPSILPSNSHFTYDSADFARFAQQQYSPERRAPVNMGGKGNGSETFVVNSSSLGGGRAAPTPNDATFIVSPTPTSHFSASNLRSLETTSSPFQPSTSASAVPSSTPSASRRKEEEDELSRLLLALKEPCVERFLTCTVEDLAMTDIPILLSDYQRMVKLNAQLVKMLNLNLSL